MQVSEAMTRDVKIARPDQTIQQAARLMVEIDAGLLPVSQGDELIGMITYGLPRVALEVGAELPELSQVADVIDLEPTFRMRAAGSLTEAEVFHPCVPCAAGPWLS